jgi:hypothetical protein
VGEGQREADAVDEGLVVREAVVRHVVEGLRTELLGELMEGLGVWVGWSSSRRGGLTQGQAVRQCYRLDDQTKRKALSCDPADGMCFATCMQLRGSS